MTTELLHRLAAERSRIDAQIRSLTSTRDRLDDILTTTTSWCTGRPCPPADTTLAP